MKFYSKVRKR